MSHSQETPAMAISAPGRIHQIDGWRALAAAAVLASHFFEHAHPGFTYRLPGFLAFLQFAGHFGLQALFIISGYIICHLLLIEERHFGSISLRGFYARRFVRVLPPFFLYLATLWLLAHFKQLKVTGQQLEHAAFLVTDFRAFSVDWTTAHVWSLSVEEQFYLVFPTLLVLTPHRRRRLVFAVICFAFMVTGILLALTHCDVMRDHAIAGFVGIFWGILFDLHEGQTRRLARRMPHWLALALAGLLAALSAFSMSGLRMVFYETIPLSPVIGLLLFYTFERESWFSTLLCWRPLRIIGITSYTLYLWQQLFTGTENTYGSIGPYVPYLLPLLFLIVPISWFAIEKPSMAYGRALSRRWRTTPAPAAGPGPRSGGHLVAPATDAGMAAPTAVE